MVNKKIVLNELPGLGIRSELLFIANPVMNFTEVQLAFLPAREVLKNSVVCLWTGPPL